MDNLTFLGYLIYLAFCAVEISVVSWALAVSTPMQVYMCVQSQLLRLLKCWGLDVGGTKEKKKRRKGGGP